MTVDAEMFHRGLIGGASVFYFVRAENILKHVSVCLQPLSKLFHENSEL